MVLPGGYLSKVRGLKNVIVQQKLFVRVSVNNDMLGYFY